MKRLLTAATFLCISQFLVGCVAGQPVEWQKAGPLDLAKGARVSVDCECEMPKGDLVYLESDIERNVREVLRGDPDAPDAYDVNVVITRYDEGDAFARFMLIGLGQMYLYGTVEVKHNSPTDVVRKGLFHKNYCLGGLLGCMATMRENVLPKVGPAIAEAIAEEPDE